MSGRSEYVVGFAIDANDRVALIRKNRPAWQEGLLNGIGGHVEPGETSDVAMRREFREETGRDVAGWEPFARMVFPGAVIDFYRVRVGTAILDGLRSTTDEQVTVRSVNDAVILARCGVAIPNLSWLIPLAAYTADRYEPIQVTAEMAEVFNAPEHAPADVPSEETPNG